MCVPPPHACRPGGHEGSRSGHPHWLLWWHEPRFHSDCADEMCLGWQSGHRPATQCDYYSTTYSTCCHLAATSGGLIDFLLTFLLTPPAHSAPPPTHTHTPSLLSTPSTHHPPSPPPKKKTKKVSYFFHQHSSVHLTQLSVSLVLLLKCHICYSSTGRHWW